MWEIIKLRHRDSCMWCCTLAEWQGIYIIQHTWHQVITVVYNVQCMHPRQSLVTHNITSSQTGEVVYSMRGPRGRQRA